MRVYSTQWSVTAPLRNWTQMGFKPMRICCDSILFPPSGASGRNCRLTSLRIACAEVEQLGQYAKREISSGREQNRGSKPGDIHDKQKSRGDGGLLTLERCRGRRSVPFPCTHPLMERRRKSVRHLPGLKCQVCPKAIHVLLARANRGPSRNAATDFMFVTNPQLRILTPRASDHDSKARSR